MIVNYFSSPKLELRLTIINCPTVVKDLHTKLLRPSMPLTHLKVLFCNMVSFMILFNYLTVFCIIENVLKFMFYMIYKIKNLIKLTLETFNIQNMNLEIKFSLFVVGLRVKHIQLVDNVLPCIEYTQPYHIIVKIDLLESTYYTYHLWHLIK